MTGSSGKMALVTGGARALANCGASVIIADIDVRGRNSSPEKSRKGRAAVARQNGLSARRKSTECRG
jgi:hypothetical protein